VPKLLTLVKTSSGKVSWILGLSASRKFGRLACKRAHSLEDIGLDARLLETSQLGLSEF
jgi:hypothetical protein